MLGKSIGEGTFGKVKAGTHIITGEKVAVKILEKSRIIEVADVKRVTREIKILKRNRHRNIIQLFEVIDTPTTIYLIMENADGGEMFDYIVSHQKVAEDLACMFFHQLIDGVDYLHGMDVTHRDLKPENLLLQSSADGWIIKIVDFGLSNTHEGNRLLGTACGSPCYAAPEMIAGKKYVGPKADIWSMGVILFALVCGYLPFEHANTNVLYKKILAGDYKCPDWVSPEVKDLIRRILNTDPETRYSIANIRRHPWYTQCNMPIVDSNSDSSKMTFDKDILQQLQDLQLEPTAVQTALRDGVHNHLTASYYLQLNRKRRNQEKKELREKMYAEQDMKQKTVEELTQEALNKNKNGTDSRESGVAAPTDATVGVGSLPLKAVAPVEIPKLPLNAIRNPLNPLSDPVGGAKEQLPDLITNSGGGGKPPKSGANARAQGRQQQAPTQSQTARGAHPNAPIQPIANYPATARPAQIPAHLVDGGLAVATSPWGNEGDRPSTRGGTRGESRNGPRNISDGLGGVEKQKEAKQKEAKQKEAKLKEAKQKAAPNAIPEVVQPAAPKAPSGSRPTNGQGGGRAGRQVKDANGFMVSGGAAAPTSSRTSGGELISQPSSRPQKALYNDVKKACKSRNIGCQQQSGLSFLCETSLSSEKAPVVFALEVEKFGDIQGMHVLKSVLKSGNEDDMRKVCKVIFNAVIVK
jgi:serine/threonine protein kinase